MDTATLHQIFLNSTGICTDTRKIKNNCLFFALKGDNFNGNSFASDALAKGAKKVIIDEPEYQTTDGNSILCEDVLTELQALATYHRQYLDLPIIALTGSNGKTTTKELLHAVLSEKFNVTATVGNLNNHIGVPLTLLSMTTETEIGIVEMGANHLREIASLSNIAKPNYGYITNFGKAHLEGFGSLEGVVKGKSELYDFIAQHGELVFVNGTDSKQMELTTHLERITFGDDAQDFTVSLLAANETVTVNFQDVEIKSKLVGAYNFNNIAAAIAIGSYFEVELLAIKRAIEGYVPKNNRSQVLVKNGYTLLLDAYNANPTSMLAALENFKQASGSPKNMILGDMFELGGTAAAEHQFIADFVDRHQFDNVFLVGENFYKTRFSGSHISKFQDFETLKHYLEKNPLPKGHLLIKGSRGMALERILDLL